MPPGSENKRVLRINFCVARKVQQWPCSSGIVHPIRLTWSTLFGHLHQPLSNVAQDLERQTHNEYKFSFRAFFVQLCLVFCGGSKCFVSVPRKNFYRGRMKEFKYFRKVIAEIYGDWMVNGSFIA